MIYAFGECVLDTQFHVLTRAGAPVHLRAKAFHLLVYLVEQRDRVVTKDELCAQVWPEQFISDATLGSTLRTVRQAIGDRGEDQGLIQTVYGYGYRWVAPVTVGAATPAAPAAEAAPAFGATEQRTPVSEQPSAPPGQPSATPPPLPHGEQKVVTVLVIPRCSLLLSPGSLTSIRCIA